MREARAEHAAQAVSVDRRLSRFNLCTAIDAIGLIVFSIFLIQLWRTPGDPLAFPALATVLCAWVVLRTVAVVGCGGRWWPAPALLALLLTLMTNHVGAFFHYRTHYFTSPESALNMIWAFNLAYLAFAAGTWTYSRASRLDTGALIENFYERPLSLEPGHQALVLPTVLLFILSVLAVLYMLGGHLPLFNVLGLLLRGQIVQASLAGLQTRLEVYQEAYRFQGYLEQFRNSVMPMIALIWFASMRISPRQLYRWLGWGGVICASVLLFARLQRGGLLLFMIQLALVTMLIYRPKPSIRWIYALAGGFGLIILLSLVLGRGAVQGGLLRNLGRQASATVYRIYAPNSEGSIKVFDLFPKVMAFRNGQTWINDYRNLLPGKGESFSREVYSKLYGGTGTAPPHFIAEMWANGGWLTVLLVSFLNGAFMQWINVRGLSTLRRTPLALVTVALTYYCTMLLGAAGLIILIERGLLAFLFLNWVLATLLKISSTESTLRTAHEVERLAPGFAAGDPVVR